MSYVPSAAQTLGPFFRHALERPGWNDLTTAQCPGERIRILGRLLDGAHHAVPDGMLEIWQADAAGQYPRTDAMIEDFRGFGRSCTDGEGHFSFTTIKPGVVASHSGVPQAPHINVTIFARGLTKALNTRIYFADCAAQNALDPLLGELEQPRRDTLILTRTHDASPLATYRFEIILQGERETAFLEI